MWKEMPVYHCSRCPQPCCNSEADRSSRARIQALKDIETFSGLTVACILVAAIELTIEWNGISGAVKDMTTAAQLIPVGIVTALLIVFVCDLGNRPPRSRRYGSSTGTYTTTTSRRSRNSGRVTQTYWIMSPDPSATSSGWSAFVRYPRSV